MKKYWFWKQGNVDPSPEALEFIAKVARGAFTAAEYCLIAGVFIFLAVETKNWAVIVLAAALSFILGMWIITLVGGFHFFLWRTADKWYLKTVFFIVDTALYLGVIFTVYTAFAAIFESFKKGIGV